LANTSCSETAAALLAQCLRGDAWDVSLVDRLRREGCDEALFRILAEGLADRFEPRLCRVYDEIFARVLEVPVPSREPVRMREFRRVFVLSRVTLGADIAVTSVVLSAAKRRFPGAEIFLVGPRKNWELLAADPRIGHVAIAYRRGTIRERLAHWPELRAAVDHADALVIDPDSRLTQLGLLPVCDPENYLFFESRSYGGDGNEALPELSARWCEDQLGVRAAPYLALAHAVESGARPAISVSLGTAENPAKRIADPFESELLRMLAQTGAHIRIDAGAGGEEADRVQRGVAGLEDRVTLCRGSFAEFAAVIAASDLYIGYDSAGQHAAAACHVPQVTVFAGEPCERMFQRWRPVGHEQIHIVRAAADVGPALEQVAAAVDDLLDSSRAK
jgi:ADP-heptose:LPS heptosyltransferase